MDNFTCLFPMPWDMKPGPYYAGSLKVRLDPYCLSLLEIPFNFTDIFWSTIADEYPVLNLIEKTIVLLNTCTY